MNTRVYLLLDILEKKSVSKIQNLRNKDGVVAVDSLEGHPNVLVIVEALDREKLVEIIMPVLGSIEHITNDLRLLLTRPNYQPPDLLSPKERDYLSKIPRPEVFPEIPVNSLVS